MSDHVTKVNRIKTYPGSLKADIILETPAERAVSGADVFHDDTAAIKKWLDQAKSIDFALRPANLWAPPGIYYVSKRLNLYSSTHIACETGAVFRNTGRSKHGPRDMFLGQSSATEAIQDIKIEYCHFDVNGWNKSEFLSFIGILGSTKENKKAEKIQIRHNEFYDTQFPGKKNCDQGRKLLCETLQRQYIVVLYVNGAWVEHNNLSHGGRIKVGRPGERIYIRHNRLDFVNDNAITIVDRKKPTSTQKICSDIMDGCLTQTVRIIGNTIIDPVAGGIFFGVDGEYDDHKDMELYDVVIRDNQITGFFSSSGIIGTLPAKTSGIQIRNNVVVSDREMQKRLRADYTSQFGIAIKSTDLGTEDSSAMKGKPKYARRISIQNNCIVARGKYARLDGGILATRKSVGFFINDNHIYVTEADTQKNLQASQAKRLSHNDCISGIEDSFFDKQKTGLIERGIRIDRPGKKNGLLGDYDNLQINYNDVRYTGIALEIKAISEGYIYFNNFIGSTNSRRGQITINESGNPSAPNLSFVGHINDNYDLLPKKWRGFQAAFAV